MNQIQKCFLLVKVCKIILLSAESGGKAVLLVKRTENMAFHSTYGMLFQ